MKLQELIHEVDNSGIKNRTDIVEHPDFTCFYVKYGYFHWMPAEIRDRKVFIIAGINATQPNTGQFKKLLYGELMKLGCPLYVECVISSTLEDYLVSQDFKYDPAFLDPPCLYYNQ